MTKTRGQNIAYPSKNIQNSDDSVSARKCHSCNKSKHPTQDFYTKGSRYESVCKDCSKARKRKHRQAKRQSVSKTPAKKPQATPSESQPVAVESNVPSVANSGDPWAKFGKLYPEPLDLHAREQIRQNLCEFFELLSKLKLEVAESILTELETEGEISSCLRNS